MENKQLRILIVTANPIRERYLDIESEVRMIEFVLEDKPQLTGIELDFLHNANINSLRNKLLEYKPHIVHLSCHGAYDQREGLGYVVLCSPDNKLKPDSVDAFRLATAFGEPKTVQLVFLSSCYGARQDINAVFSGVAQCIHAAGIPAVAALQVALVDKTSHAIGLNFYRYLLREQLSVEECINRIRRYLFICELLAEMICFLR